MADDWQVGDLALCVDNARHDDLSIADRILSVGVAYRVAAVLPPIEYCHTRALGLMLEGAPNLAPNAYSQSFAADRFRKIRPDEHEPCEEEFVTLLNRTKRTVRA